MMRAPISLRLGRGAWAALNADSLAQAIAKLGSRNRKFTAADVAGVLRTRKVREISLHLEALIEEGVLRRATGAGAYRCVRKPEVTGESAIGAKRQHMWNILRGRQAKPSITVEDLAVLSSTDTHPVSHAEALAFVTLLLEAGWLANRGAAGVLLHSDRAGPIAPAVMQNTFLVDRNAGTVAWTNQFATEAGQ
jgi:hypothetical protein